MAEEESEYGILDETIHGSESAPSSTISPVTNHESQKTQLNGDQDTSGKDNASIPHYRPLEDFAKKKDEPNVLEPDHPLMERFQISLKAHLERQNTRLTEEVLELEAVLKKKEMEREDMGVMLYDIQQEVSKQLSTLETFRSQLTSTTENRQEIENEVRELKKQYKMAVKDMARAEKKEFAMRSDLQRLLILERQFKEWEDDMSSELAVSERVSEKGKIDKRQLTEDKRKQDILLYKLTSEVANLEAKITMLDGQILVKEKEQFTLGQTVADANTDLEALSREQRRLMHAWNAVLNNMQQKDRIYSEIVHQRDQLDEELLNIENEIGSYKSASRRKMEENEQVTQVLNRMKMQMQFFINYFRKGERKVEDLDATLSEKSAMLQQTERDIEEETAEYNKLHRHCSSLLDEIQKLSIQKTAFQDRILEHFENKRVQNNASKFMSKTLQEIRQKTEDLDVRLVTAENKYAKCLYDIEKQKGVIYQNQLKLNELQDELSAQEREIDEGENNLNRSKFLVCKKQGIVDNLNKKLEVIVEKAGGEELSPLELKIIALQKSLVEADETSEKKQQFWLRQQGHIINLTHKRNEQLQEIDILRKQVLILDQKNLKIEHDIERHNKEAQDVSRSINKLLHKLAAVNTKLNEQRGYKKSLDKNNLLTQTEYINVLKDAEMESLNLQAEISDLEQEKIQLTECLLQTQQESLAWEKKLQMALETKESIHKEKSKEGEIGAMKSELHRQHVQYSQLRRIQDKLMHDLEHCISRRDAIVDVAEAREKKSVKGTHNTRVSFQKKLDDLRNKIKQLNNESKSVDKLITEEKTKKEVLQDQTAQKQAQLDEWEDVIRQIDEQLEEAKLLKQGNLELLIRLQRKVRMYEELKAGRYKLQFRNIQNIESDSQKQKSVNDDLTTVVFSLLNEFPSLRISFSKILSTLRPYSPLH